MMSFRFLLGRSKMITRVSRSRSLAPISPKQTDGYRINFDSVGFSSIPVYPLNPSIESIKLKIDDKSKAPRQIYGLIKVPRPCLPIFYRHWDTAQPVPDSDDDDIDGFPLILCGPSHSIVHDEGCREITVDLYGERSRPFIAGRFILTDNLGVPPGGRVNVPVKEYIYLPDGSGRLTLTYSRIGLSSNAIFDFRLVHAFPASSPLVTGTIRGIHSLPEEALPTPTPTPNWITIFDSRGQAVPVPQGHSIPLDRYTFVVPIQVGKRGTEGFCGGSFDVHVDLQMFVHDMVFSIKGKKKVAFHKTPKRWLIRSKVFTVGQSQSDGPVIQISLKRIAYCWPRVEEIESVEH